MGMSMEVGVEVDMEMEMREGYTTALRYIFEHVSERAVMGSGAFVNER